MQKKQTQNLLIATITALVVWAISLFLYSTLDDGFVNRLAIFMGGDIKKGGYIQFFTYIAFFWCCSEIREYGKFLENEENIIIKHQLLPSRTRDPFKILSFSDVNNLRMEAIKIVNQEGASIFLDLIKKSTTKFRTSRSISEMMEVISSQVRIYQASAESDQSIMRYLVWVIPSLGFVGTVMGISSALAIADSADTKEVTEVLGLAFDTTLLSLILSIIIMYFIQNVQKKTDDFYAFLEDYMMDNLVNRIEL